MNVQKRWNNVLNNEITETLSNKSSSRKLSKDKNNVIYDNFDGDVDDDDILFPELKKKLKSKHPKNIFFGCLNVNSVCNKLESIEEIIKDTNRENIPPSSHEKYEYVYLRNWYIKSAIYKRFLYWG